MIKNARTAGLSEKGEWRTMIRNLKADGAKAAKAESYMMWFILGMLGHIVTLAWVEFTTPHVPMAIDEESPTGHDDHEVFAQGFQEQASAERMRYAWMGTRVGAPLQILAAVFTLVSTISNSGFFDREQSATIAPTEQAALTNTADADAGTADAPANMPARETEQEVVLSLRVDEDHEGGNPGDRATAELLAGYDCTPNADRNVFDCTQRAETAAWVEPTGTWRGMYSRRGTPTPGTGRSRSSSATTRPYDTQTARAPEPSHQRERHPAPAKDDSTGRR